MYFEMQPVHLHKTYEIFKSSAAQSSKPRTPGLTKLHMAKSSERLFCNGAGKKTQARKKSSPSRKDTASENDAALSRQHIESIDCFVSITVFESMT